MKKIIAIILMSLLSLSAAAVEVSVTYDGAWKKITIDTEAKVMKLQVWRASKEKFVDKFVLNNANIITGNESIRVFSDDEETREMGSIIKKEAQEVEVSSFLYKNKKYLSSEHQNVDQFFDF